MSSTPPSRCSVGVIYTGQPRTMSKTLPYLVQNLLHPNQADVYAVLDSSETPDLSLLQPYLKGVLVQPFSTDARWTHIRELLLTQIPIGEDWKEYLRTSGSMVEHYQFFLGAQALLASHRTYDFVVRIRTDLVITRVVHLSPHHTLTPHFDQYMNQLFFPDRNSYENHIQSIPEDWAKYLAQGNFMITIRKNVVFVLPYKHLSEFSRLGIEYGKHRMEVDYWYNSENQLIAKCKSMGLDVFESCLVEEERSLYEYETDRYWIDGKPRTDILFFLCRS